MDFITLEGLRAEQKWKISFKSQIWNQFFYQNIKWSRSSVFFFSSKKINLYIFNVSVLKKIPVMESMAFLSLKDITSAKPEVVLPVFFSIFNPSFESKVWGVKPMVRVRKFFCTGLILSQQSQQGYEKPSEFRIF